jgi:hypothetical protein
LAAGAQRGYHFNRGANNGELKTMTASADDGAPEDKDAAYRWDGGKWRGGCYPNWEAGQSDYQADERRLWADHVRATRANVVISFATLVAAIVAGIVAYGAYQTGLDAVAEGKRQTAEAKRQADAADRQINLAKEAEFRQLRAYVYVRRYSIVADQTTAAAKVEVYHAGRTPAYRIRIDTQMMVAPYLVGELKLPDVTSPSVGSVDHTEHSILYSTEFLPQTTVMPKGTEEAMRLVWSKDSAIGDQRLYLHGVVRYLDVFGIEGLQPERRYEFCFVYHPERDVMGSEHGCEKYNKPG